MCAGVCRTCSEPHHIQNGVVKVPQAPVVGVVCDGSGGPFARVCAHVFTACTVIHGVFLCPLPLGLIMMVKYYIIYIVYIIYISLFGAHYLQGNLIIMMVKQNLETQPP